MQAYTTIITTSHYFYAKALYDSIKIYDSHLNFHVLVVDNENEVEPYENIVIHRLKEIKKTFPDDYALIEKYEIDKASNLRWALKPLLLKYLLLTQGYDKTIFLDPDLCFYNNPLFLFEELNNHSVLVTPHWRSSDAFIDSGNFDLLFTGGLFNAGFFACNKKAIAVLDWWLKCCSYRMEKQNGFYVDQIYLNLMPIYFPNQVKVLQHKGCNVANWNMIECPRVKKENEVIIEGTYPIVFIHFTNGTISTILNGRDALLKPLLEKYVTLLKKHNRDFKTSQMDNSSKQSWINRLKKLKK